MKIAQPKPPEVKPPHDLDSTGTLKLEGGLTIEVNANELIEVKSLGRGTYGAVYEMYHRASSTTMAVKKIRCTMDSEDEKRLLMDLDITRRATKSGCEFTVLFYGALFQEGDVWICMEKMNHSLDVLYKEMKGKLDKVMPELVLGRVAYRVVKALQFLKETFGVIHRDVKPSNILIDLKGTIKLCDFGISGVLISSIAKTLEIGCKLYMAPERIDPSKDRKYDIRSDVWSLGITIVELAIGKFPYPPWDNTFQHLKTVVSGDAPGLPSDAGFSQVFHDFVRQCLQKDPQFRPKYAELLLTPFLQIQADSIEKETGYDVGGWYCGILDNLGAKEEPQVASAAAACP